MQGRKNGVQLPQFVLEEKNSLIADIDVDGTNYFIYTNKHGIPIVTNNINKYLRVKQKIKCRITKNYVYFYGILSNIEEKMKGFENIYLNDKEVGKIKRFFNVPKLKHLMVAKIKITDILDSDEIHNTVRIGKDFRYSVPVSIKKKHKEINYYTKKRINDDLLIIRSVINSSKIRITKVLFESEYKKINLLKNKIAKMIYKFVPTRKINLMFEKETNKANESAYYMFEKIMEKQKNEKLKTRTYFIINKTSPDYETIKKKYGKNIIEKYTFRHYLYIYKSKCFISSELSNHVLNPRLYNRDLNRIIARKPLIFLQHGIMFAKPVDNPAAAGFRKKNRTVKFSKCVISSELEATQFYKLGFNRFDLIKCGLPKFDISYQSPEADKIMFMPTYRYWEEGQVMNPDTIKETTYYQNFMTVIDKFREAGLLEKLSISCHPKFADCLINADPIYENIVEKDINKGLENAKVFITDYSSASYDAHYRGAYVIYYWAEKDYLIENYKAIPPVDERNCDGVPVYDVDSLINEVKKAINNNYKMDKMFEERYSKINEFRDGKNGDRLIEELKKLDII